MPLSLPEVKPVTLNFEPELNLKTSDINVSNDHGTPNLLLLYYTPFLPDDKKVDLEAIQDEFQTWNAWELGQAESQLIGHVQNGRLPSDDSIASRVIRNNFRSKALGVFRKDGQACGSIDVERENKILFTHVYYMYDSDSRRFLPSVLDTSFGIKKQESEGSKDDEDKFKVEFNFLLTKYSFDRNFWRTHRHEGEKAIEQGEPIRKQMALDFYVNS